MPAQICHYLHGIEVLEKTQLPFKNQINKQAFIMGTQGPDFIFTHRFMPWMKGESIEKLGHDIHNFDPVTLILHMKSICDNSKVDILYSYYLGFLCHYSLDSICHPYVNALSKKICDDLQTENICHIEIESALDKIFGQANVGKSIYPIALKNLMPTDKNIHNEVGNLYYLISKDLFNRDIPKEIFIQSIKDCRVTFDILQDSFGLKRLIIDKIEKNKKHSLSSHLIPRKVTQDFVNINKEFWSDNNNQNFYELFDSAIKRATKLVEGFTKEEFIKITNNESF